MNEKTLSTYDRKKYTYFAITNVCVYVYIRLYTLKKKKEKHRYNKWINKQGCIVRSFVY